MEPLAVRVPPQLRRDLDVVARARGRRLADEIRDALRLHVEAAVTGANTSDARREKPGIEVDPGVSETTHEP